MKDRICDSVNRFWYMLEDFLVRSASYTCDPHEP
jgi:hypothetical protein